MKQFYNVNKHFDEGCKPVEELYMSSIELEVNNINARKQIKKFMEFSE